MNKNVSANEELYHAETTILTSLRHDNVVELREHFQDKKHFLILTTLYQGGELFDRVRRGSFSENSASKLTASVLKAIAYCHENNVVHRDLKPENFVFETDDIESNMRLIDFGCAKKGPENNIIGDIAGSPYYFAPELFSDMNRTGKTWKASDMWSVGVIIFLFVCGYPPFNGESQEKIFRRIRRGKFRFPKDQDGVKLSESVKDLIKKLLVSDPDKRLTAKQALTHPWIASDDAPKEPMSEKVIQNIVGFQKQCKLTKAVGRALKNHMTDDDKANLAEVFAKFDVNKDGRLGPEEVSEMMKFIGRGEGDAEEFLAELDDDNDGGLDIEEFQIGHAMGKLANNEGEVKKAFEKFDTDGDGFVTHLEIEKVCDFLSPAATAQLISDVDANNDGRINFDEWLEAMSNQSVGKQAAAVNDVPDAATAN